MALSSTSSYATAPDYDQWYLNVSDHSRLYVYETGRSDANTILVLHGGYGAEHSYLLKPLEVLKPEFRLVFFDQRGSLRSPTDPRNINFDKLVEDIEILRKQLGKEKITILAHSMGNSLAYGYLHKYASHVNGLILVGAVHPASFNNGGNLEFIKKVWPEVDANELIEDKKKWELNWRNQAKIQGLKSGVIPEELAGVAYDDIEKIWKEKKLEKPNDKRATQLWRLSFAAVNSCKAERWREMEGGMIFYNSVVGSAVFSPANAKSLNAAMKNLWPDLQAYSGPVRVIMGSCDYVDYGPKIWPHIIPKLKNAKLNVINDSGHSIWMDQPEEFSQTLLNAAREINAPGH